MVWGVDQPCLKISSGRHRWQPLSMGWSASPGQGDTLTKHTMKPKETVCGLWSELPPTGQHREVGAAEAAAPAAKSARDSSKQRPQLTTPWRREALGARPPPGTNSPTANKRQPGERKGVTPKQTKGKPTKTWPPKGPQEGANENSDNLKGGCTRAKPKETEPPGFFLVKETSSRNYIHMDVSKNSGTPKSSILIGFSIINHPFWGTFVFGNTHIAEFAWAVWILDTF